MCKICAKYFSNQKHILMVFSISSLFVIPSSNTRNHESVALMFLKNSFKELENLNDLSFLNTILIFDVELLIWAIKSTFLEFKKKLNLRNCIMVSLNVPYKFQLSNVHFYPNVLLIVLCMFINTTYGNFLCFFVSMHLNFKHYRHL